MDTKLFFGDATAFETPMLAVFAVDLAVGKDAEPRPALLSSLSSIQVAASVLLATGEFKAGLGEIALLHAPAVRLHGRAGRSTRAPNNKVMPSKPR